MLRTVSSALLLLLLASTALAAGQDVADEVFYQFMPIAWRDASGDAYRFGDFDGMTASLDYLVDLGVTAIWMNPVFPSPAYHGYQHGRADQLNAWFGTESQFVNFIQQAHARGLKVFVDFVAYGISQDSMWFQDAYGNPASAYDDWLAFENGSNTNFLGSNYTTWNGSDVGFIHWDLRNANPVQLVTQWAQKWLDPNTDGFFDDGLDGYRLDHVWQTYPNGPDGWGYHIDTFWAPWRDALRSVNPDVFVFAEQADWGSHGEELLVGMDAAFTKPFEFAARDALANEYSAPLRGQTVATMAALANAPAAGTFLCTINDHDITRLATAIGPSFAKGKAAAAVLLSQPFAPIIYYGDEIGMRGAKDPSLGGDASDIPMREPFKWNAVAGPPMTNYYALHGPAFTNRIERDNDGRSVEEQDGVPGSLLEAYKDLIAARKASVALRRGGTTDVPCTDGAVWSFVRDDAAQQVLVLINLAGSTVNAQLDLSLFTVAGGSTTPTDLLTGATWPAIDTANQGSYSISLGAYQYVLLEAGLEPLPPVPTDVDGASIPTDFYSQAEATQDTPTSLGDNVGELDQLFLRTDHPTFPAKDDTEFWLGLTGNLVPDGWGLCILFDTQAGGQNPLDLNDAFPPPNGPQMLTGLELDAGFTPDFMFYINSVSGTLYLDQYELLTAGGVSKTYRGSGIVGSGNGILSGGDNPLGLECALNNSNTAGVTDADASGANTATTGLEMRIPLPYVGIANLPSSLRMAAFILWPDGTVSNQWLPGIGGQSGDLGIAPDMTQVPGQQWIEIDMPWLVAVDPVPRGLTLSFANPARSRASMRLTLPSAGSVEVDVLDLRGRRLRSLVSGDAAAGELRMEWDGRDGDGAAAASGVYFLRVKTRDAELVRRLVFLR